MQLRKLRMMQKPCPRDHQTQLRARLRQLKQLLEKRWKALLRLLLSQILPHLTPPSRNKRLRQKLPRPTQTSQPPPQLVPLTLMDLLPMKLTSLTSETTIFQVTSPPRSKPLLRNETIVVYSFYLR